jgi:hypothetical protein
MITTSYLWVAALYLVVASRASAHEKRTFRIYNEIVVDVEDDIKVNGVTVFSPGYRGTYEYKHFIINYVNETVKLSGRDLCYFAVGQRCEIGHCDGLYEQFGPDLREFCSLTTGLCLPFDAHLGKLVLDNEASDHWRDSVLPCLGMMDRSYRMSVFPRRQLRAIVAAFHKLLDLLMEPTPVLWMMLLCVSTWGWSMTIAPNRS